MRILALLYRRQDDDFGFLELTVCPHPSDYRLYADVIGSQASQIDDSPQRDGITAQHASVGTRTGLYEAHLVPNAVNVSSPLRQLAGTDVVALPQSYRGGVSRIVQLRQILADHPLAVEIGTDIPKRE